MRTIHVVLTLINLLPFVQSSCLEFWRNWKTCPLEQFPDIPRDKLLCFHELTYASEVLISTEDGKLSAVLCHNKTFPSDIFDCLPVKDSLVFTLKNCPFPSAKFDKTFGIENSTLKGLRIQYENSALLQRSLHVTGIPHLQLLRVDGILTTGDFSLLIDALPSLIILYINNHSFTALPGTPFKNVSSLQSLTISQGYLEFLQNGIFSGINPVILELSQNRLEAFSPKLLLNFSNLKTLNLSHNCIGAVEELLFENTPDLEIVTLDHNKLGSLPTELFFKTPNLTVISLDHNRLQNIPEIIFNKLYRLRLLSLDNNRLTALSPNVFDNLVSLVWLDVQFNRISTLHDNLFNSLTRLQVLDLSNNSISSLPSRLPFGKSRFLSKVNMSGNRLDEFPDIYWLHYNITQLDLSHNLIHQIVLPVKLKPGASIFLQNNQISTVTINRPLNNEAHYFLKGNPFNCICNLSEFIHFMPHLSIGDVEDLKCRTPWYRNHKYLREFTAVSKLCETRDYCPNGCKCHLSAENSITLDCSNSKMLEPPRSLPPLQATIMHFENNQLVSLDGCDWLEVTHLYLSNNSLTSLQNWTVPPKLQFLAIDGNKLVNFPSNLMKTVDEDPNFRIHMSNNEWLCDCNSVHLKKWLMRNLPKVQDSMHIYCKNNHERSKRNSLMVETRIEEFVCSEAIRSTWLKNQLYITVFVIIFLVEQFQNKML